MWRRITVLSGMCAAFLSVGATTAISENMTGDRLLAICEAPDVQAATVQGDKLGWQRLTERKQRNGVLISFATMAALERL